MITPWSELDPLDEQVIAAGLRTRLFGRPLEVHTTLGSTLDRARELAAGGAGEGCAVLAEEQTGGRGRRGRRWESPAGMGLWVAILMRVTGLEPGLLTLGCAVAVRRAVVRAGGPALDVKWPNDLETGGRKACGILVEVVPGGLAAIGIGVNVHQTDAEWPPELRFRAISLDRAGGCVLERNRLAVCLFESIEEMHAVLRSGRSELLLDAWRDAACHLGRRVRVATPAGDLEGLAADVDATGALCLRRDTGVVERVLAGSLTLVDPPTVDG